MVEILVKTSAIIDTATLVAQTALLQTNLMSDADANFMWKNIRTEFEIVVGDPVDILVLVLASSDATVAQIKEGLANTEVGRDNAVLYRVGQQQVRQVWDFFIVPWDRKVASEATSFTRNWKLPPKGVPTLKGGGLAIFCFNMSPSNNFANGPIVTTLTKSMGGWF